MPRAKTQTKNNSDDKPPIWNMPNRVNEFKPKKKRYWVPMSVSGFPGLGMHFHKNGKRSWIISYRIGGTGDAEGWRRYGVKKVAVLGLFHPLDCTLDEIRPIGREFAKEAASGVDPVNKVAEAPKRVTFATMADVYIERYAKPKKSSWETDRRVLNKDVIPYIGTMAPNDIKQAHILAVLERVADRGAPSGADRLKAILNKVFEWGENRYDIARNPCRKIDKFVVRASKDEKLGAVPLDPSQIATFWHGLDKTKMSEVSKLALRLLMTTGVRPKEAVEGKWEEIHGDLTQPGAVWVIPGRRMKARLTHRVPLSDLARQVLISARAAQADRPSDYFFPSPQLKWRGKPVGDRPLSRPALKTALYHTSVRQPLGLRVGQVPYSLRKFVATTIGEHLCHPGTGIRYNDEDVGMILAHARPGVTKIYNGALYDRHKLMMLKQIANQIRHLAKLGPPEPLEPAPQALDIAA